MVVKRHISNIQEAYNWFYLAFFSVERLFLSSFSATNYMFIAWIILTLSLIIKILYFLLHYSIDIPPLMLQARKGFHASLIPENDPSLSVVTHLSWLRQMIIFIKNRSSIQLIIHVYCFSYTQIYSFLKFTTMFKSFL